MSGCIACRRAGACSPPPRRLGEVRLHRARAFAACRAPRTAPAPTPPSAPLHRHWWRGRTGTQAKTMRFASLDVMYYVQSDLAAVTSEINWLIYSAARPTPPSRTDLSWTACSLGLRRGTVLHSERAALGIARVAAPAGSCGALALGRRHPTLVCPSCGVVEVAGPSLWHATYQVGAPAAARRRSSRAAPCGRGGVCCAGVDPDVQPLVEAQDPRRAKRRRGIDRGGGGGSDRGAERQRLELVPSARMLHASGALKVRQRRQDAVGCIKGCGP